MTNNEKKYYINTRGIAYYSGYDGIEIKEIQNGFEDYIIFVAGAWCANKSVHCSKIYFTNAGSPFFKYKSYRIPLDECIRM